MSDWEEEYEADGAPPKTAPGRSSTLPGPGSGSFSAAAGTVSKAGWRVGRPEPRAALRFSVDRAAVGAVIGRGGATVRELEANSGARIKASVKPVGGGSVVRTKVSRGEYGGEVRVYGTEDVQKRAREMIEALISRSAGDERDRRIPRPSR
ncbi:hypothetical protein Z043_120701 [Scleropages formosus]|uniref:K Homology domain-containing protein n=1 Tax=Scleropages formosus TaxID=113540 RepID=A0A0P7TUB2_SCLFO|nr:hypothetical protein Z043_120701 [Scleropages formosus]